MLVNCSETKTKVSSQLQDRFSWGDEGLSNGICNLGMSSVHGLLLIQGGSGLFTMALETKLGLE